MLDGAALRLMCWPAALNAAISIGAASTSSMDVSCTGFELVVSFGMHSQSLYVLTETAAGFPTACGCI
jgi:hypothetical protein